MKEIVKDLVHYLKKLGVAKHLLPKSIMEFSRLFDKVIHNNCGLIIEKAVTVILLKPEDEKYKEKFKELSKDCDFDRRVAIYIFNPADNTYFYDELSIDKFLSLITNRKLSELYLKG